MGISNLFLWFIFICVVKDIPMLFSVCPVHMLSHATHVLHVAHKPKFFGNVKDYLESDAYRALAKGGKRQ